jgi:hypothetical protein
LSGRAIAFGLVALTAAGGATSYFAGYRFGATAKDLGVARQRPAEDSHISRDKTLDGRDVVAGGTVLNPQGIDNPGNPEHAVEDFRRIYRYLDGFRKEAGRLPTAEEFLERRVLKDGFQLEVSDLENPDWTSADGLDAINRVGRGCHSKLSFGTPRPDGTPKPAFPNVGERDLWMLSELTARSNTVMYPGGKQKSRFTGYFVGLFSDGSIETFKHREMLFVRRPGEPGKEYLTVPGVARLPDKVIRWPDHPAYKPRDNYEVTFED